jgi:hypothetical protein
MPTSTQGRRLPLLLAAAAALCLGLYARLKGLGGAPFAVDEYYLARAIDGILRTGLPAFTCGGLYMRGLLLQYAAAALQWSGVTPELAPRLLSALGSLLSIPAVFLLGRRLVGRSLAWLAVILVALSVWEIEIARFGRMYAPFQADFLWYLVFFLRYTVDRDARALWPMILLSAIGPLVWEGGVFLPLLNLLSLFLQRWPERMRPQDWRFLLGCGALLLLSVWLVTADFRGYNALSWPPGYAMSQSRPALDRLTTLRLPLGELTHHALWLAVAVLPLLLILPALRRVWQWRERRFLAAGLLALLLAAMAHQFLAVASVALLLVLMRLMSWRECFGRTLRPLHAAIIACALFWLAFGASRIDWQAGNRTELLAMLAYRLLSFPDLLQVVVRPWAAAVPHLGAALMLLIAGELIAAARDEQTPEYERVLLTAFLVLLLAAGASHPPREETRYVFFLYPVALLIALQALSRLSRLLAGERPPLATGLTTVLALGGFACSEDFQPRFLLAVDAPAQTFHEGLSPAMQSHLIIRENFRALADWVRQHRAAQDLVINDVHGMDRYYPDINYFYVDEDSPNFPDWSCQGGTLERWGGYPLLYDPDALRERLAPGTSAYLVAFVYDRDQILHDFAGLQPRVVASAGDTLIFELKG